MPFALMLATNETSGPRPLTRTLALSSSRRADNATCWVIIQSLLVCFENATLRRDMVCRKRTIESIANDGLCAALHKCLEIGTGSLSLCVALAEFATKQLQASASVTLSVS